MAEGEEGVALPPRELGAEPPEFEKCYLHAQSCNQMHVFWVRSWVLWLSFSPPLFQSLAMRST